MWNHKRSSHSRGYGRQWQRLRQSILERDEYLCVSCLKRGILTPATDVDHITPKAKGGSDLPDNLQSLCSECHKDKTTRDNGGTPREGSSISGEPINPGDPWYV